MVKAVDSGERTTEMIEDLSIIHSTAVTQIEGALKATFARRN